MMKNERYLEMPWSVEDTIENLKEIKECLQNRAIIRNLHGRGEKDAEEVRRKIENRNDKNSI